MDHLRSIALTVEENEPGQFTWLLLESQGDAIVFDTELQVADQPLSTYEAALRQGMERMLALGRDASRGPRESAHNEIDDPVIGTDAYGGNP